MAVISAPTFTDKKGGDIITITGHKVSPLTNGIVAAPQPVVSSGSAGSSGHAIG